MGVLAKLDNILGYAKECAQKDRIKAKKQRQDRAPKRLTDRYRLPSKTDNENEELNQGGPTICSGDIKVKNLKDALAKIDTKHQRESHQIKIHNSCISACLPQIYGTELLPNMSRILKEHRLKEFSTQQLIVMPRRFGKTWAMAMIAAAYAWTQPGSEVSIYSTCRRASRAILVLIYRFVNELANGDDSIIINYNQEILVIKSMDGCTRSQISSYPSRGKVIILFYFIFKKKDIFLSFFLFLDEVSIILFYFYFFFPFSLSLFFK